MSIVVNNVSKLYGDQLALNKVSFEVKKGEIVGFLGPNGAGKSTMMKIITCYIPPTEGDVSALAGRVTTTEGDISTLSGRVTTNEGNISTLNTPVWSNPSMV